MFSDGCCEPGLIGVGAAIVRVKTIEAFGARLPAEWSDVLVGSTGSYKKARPADIVPVLVSRRRWPEAFGSGAAQRQLCRPSFVP